jgi:hypothetical protein
MTRRFNSAAAPATPARIEAVLAPAATLIEALVKTFRDTRIGTMVVPS